MFSGYGSQALALKYLGYSFNHHFVCDVNKYAIQAYNDIHGTNFLPMDIRDVGAADLMLQPMETYLMTYSFPCTDLSTAGNKRGMDANSGTSSSLVWEVHRILSECSDFGILPQYVVMENVDSILSKRYVSTFGNWIKCLIRLGYKNYYKILNARDYGIPQNRKRCFMVSVLRNGVNGVNSFSFPRKEPLTTCLEDLLEKDVDFPGYVVTQEKLEKVRHTKFLSKRFEVLDQTGKCVCNTLLAHDGSSDCRKFIKMPNDCYRFLTSREYFRLMGVRDADYEKLTVSDDRKYNLAGNSIVVNVLMAIFRNLFECGGKRRRLF